MASYTRYDLPLLEQIFSILIIDPIFQITTSSAIENDSVDQLQNKLKRYTAEMEKLRNRGIGKSTSQDIPFETLSLSPRNG